MPLTAGQIHQVQLGLPDVLVAQGVAVDHLQVDGEDGVGPGGVRVHGGGRGHPVGDALLEQHGHLGDTVHLGGEDGDGVYSYYWSNLPCALPGLLLGLAADECQNY